MIDCGTTPTNMLWQTDTNNITAYLLHFLAILCLCAVQCSLCNIEMSFAKQDDYQLTLDMERKSS